VTAADERHVDAIPVPSQPAGERVLSDATAQVISTYRRLFPTGERRKDLLAPARPSPGVPGWLRVFADVHTSQASPVVAAVDLLLLASVLFVVPQHLVPPPSAFAVAVLAGGAVLAGYAAGVYRDRDTVETQGVLWYPMRVLGPVALAVGVALAAHQVSGRPALVAGCVMVAALTALRSACWLVLAASRRRGRGLLPTLILGDGAAAALVARKLVQFPEAGLYPLPVRSLEDVLLGEGLCDAVRDSGAGHVILVPEATADMAIAATLRRFAGLPASFSMVPPLPDLFLSSARVGEIGGLPLIPLGRLLRGRTAFPGKRLFDLVFGTLLLLVSAPVLALAAFAVKLGDGGPVFYRQPRVGRGGRVFQMRKVRSMVVGADALRATLAEHNVSDGLLFRMAADPRVTRVGRLLRALSIDELPQLFNVLRGEMSLVGPRPLPVAPDAFGALENERHTVLPGITGYWQVSGANGLSFEEMVKIDLAYIHNWSLWLDIRLILRTLPALLHRRDPA
jgi:exopolysaccharide biosynthesis polyprenyl glycosylphosphotransferase